MNKLFTFLMGIFFLGIVIGCEKTDKNSIPENYDSIRYGTSFGECVGYCKRSIEIRQSEIEYIKSSWNDSVEYPQIRINDSFDTDDWNALLNSIELEVFFELDPVLGCPDCADGGAEWIEIQYGDTIHRVTFEYRNEPSLMKAYIEILRSEMDEFDQE